MKKLKERVQKAIAEGLAANTTSDITAKIDLINPSGQS